MSYRKFMENEHTCSVCLREHDNCNCEIACLICMVNIDDCVCDGENPPKKAVDLGSDHRCLQSGITFRSHQYHEKYCKRFQAGKICTIARLP